MYEPFSPTSGSGGGSEHEKRGENMSKKEKSHPLVAQETGQAETAAYGRAAISYDYSTTAPACRQAISDLLCVGEVNGMTLRQLKEILDGDGRSIRAQIERERRDTPILSGQTGYFLPEREDEVRRFCASMRHRARQVWATAANVERAAGLARQKTQQLDGQGCIWAGGDSNG